MPRTTRTIPHGRRAAAVTGVAAAALALLPAVAGARLGDLDPGFGGAGTRTVAFAPPFQGAFEAVATRPDGRPVAVGSITDGTVQQAFAAQFTPSGDNDAQFGAGGVSLVPLGGIARRLHGMALGAGGRILAAGDERSGTAPPTATNPILLQFAENGGVADLDQIGTTAGEAHAVLPLADGRILVAGSLQIAPGGPSHIFVARLQADGSPDGSFGGGIVTVPVGEQSRALALGVDASGRILVGGWSFAANATSPVVVRLGAEGVLDETFGTAGVLSPIGTNPDGQTAGIVNDLAVDGLGRVTVAGESGRFAFLARIVGNGGLDPGFGAGGLRYGAIDEDATVAALALDGTRLLVGGAAGPGRGPSDLLLGILDAAGTPDAGLGGTPPGWRRFALGAPAAALGVAPGPAGTVYTAGGVGTTPIVARHLPNAAPAASLAAEAGAVAGVPTLLDASGSSDPEGEPLRFAFDLDGDGTFELDTGVNPRAEPRFSGAGARTVGVRVSDPRGASAVATRAIRVVGRGPRPVLSKQGVARPVRGKVRVRLPGRRRFVPLKGLTAIPNGTEIDARKGRVLITVLHDASGKEDSARFYAGRFVFRQGKGRAPITTLRLTGGSFAGCGAGPARAGALRAAAASAQRRKKKKVRSLWGDGRGRFRTRGRYGAATVRGTKWLTRDRCDGTLVRVVRGKVAVADLVRPKRRVAVVRAGRQLLVPAKGRG